MQLLVRQKSLLRPGTVVAVVATMLISFYLYSKFQQCCGGELHLLSCTLRRVDTEWKPTMPDVSDACYHSNLLTRLKAMFPHDGIQRQLSIRPGFHAALKVPTDLASLTSETCANALVPTDSQLARKLNDSNCFKRLLSQSDMTQTYEQLRYLLSNFTSHGLEIFLMDGSLIGSVRHFGLVPWDDDLDFGIRVDQKSAVRRLLEELSAGSSPFLFTDTESLNLHWKLGIMCAVGQTKGTKSCRVAIDLFFVRNSGRWFVRHEWPNTFPIEDIYPLSWRPFGPGLLLPSPRRPQHFLQRQYKSDVMKECHYQPHTSTSCSQPNMPCLAMQKLGVHPFVKFVRLPAPAGLSGKTNVTVELLLFQRKLMAVFLPIED